MTQTLRRVLPRLLIVALWILSLWTAAAIGYRQGKREPPPQDAEALAGRAAALGFRPVVVSPHAVYVCDRERSPDELAALPRTPEALPQWRGVVLCEKSAYRVAPDEPGRGTLVNGWTLYGDPEMAERLRALLR